jgi:hypothetical protein
MASLINAFSQRVADPSLSVKDFNKIINQQFASLISPISKNNIGNFASLDLKDATVNFNGTSFLKNGSFFGIKATGKVTDGFLPIFSNASLNTDVGIDVQYNFLGLKKRLLFESWSLTAKKRDSLNIEAEYAIKLIEADNNYGKITLQLEIESLTKKASRLSDALTEATSPLTVNQDKADSIRQAITKINGDIQQKQQDLANPATSANDRPLLRLAIANLEKKKSNVEKALDKVVNPVAITNSKIDSIRNSIAKLNQQIADKKAQHAIPVVQGEARALLERARAKALKKLDTVIVIRGFAFGWWSIGYGLKNSSFKLFDSSLPFDQQVTKKDFATHVIRVQRSYFKSDPVIRRSYYWSLGMDLSVTDNLQELTSKELSETTNYGPSSGVRSSFKKYNVYEGDYSSGLKSISFHGDAYWFLLEDNRGALHVYPEYKVKDMVEPTANLGIGFLMTFKDKDKLQNTLNAELYANFQNLAKTNEVTGTLLNRSSFGLRFTFPINFTSK